VTSVCRYNLLNQISNVLIHQVAPLYIAQFMKVMLCSEQKKTTEVCRVFYRCEQSISGQTFWANVYTDVMWFGLLISFY